MSTPSPGPAGSYPDYATLTRQLETWATTYPAFTRLCSLETTPEGRSLWLLSIGANPDAGGPAVWVDGNIHAIELAGSSVALDIAQAALALHVDDLPTPDLPEPVLEAARRVTFHVIPRLSPDGAEMVLRTGRYLRSAPRDRRSHPGNPRWHPQDVDGDGLALSMRIADASGEYAESTEEPGLLRPRTVDDRGPFYRVYPEGLIEPFDGHTVPDPDYLSDNSPDFNRNFPCNWAPEEQQYGAGPLPLSEPETRAVAEFAEQHPEIFAWLDLHTFGGVFIRPLGTGPDTEMNPGDLALYRQVAEWAEQLTGYPTVSGHDEFTYEPGKPLRGDLSDYAYHQRGCLTITCELWDLFTRLGIPRRRPFLEHYSHLGEAELLALIRWDREENEGRLKPPWRPVEHPQLGAVDVGGWNPLVGVYNPPNRELPALGQAMAALWLRVAALAPCIEIAAFRSRPLGDDTTLVEAKIRNSGYLATYGMPSAWTLRWNYGLQAQLETDGPALVPPDDGRRDAGHLNGWGRGRFDGSALLQPYSRGSGHMAHVTWTVRGRGELHLHVRGPRIGHCRASLHID